MKFFKDLLSKFLIGRICKTIGSLRDYLKDYEYVSDSFYSDAFKTVIKEYLNVDIKKDWIGRLYGIANPNMNDNGKFDITRTIIELDGDNTNNEIANLHYLCPNCHALTSTYRGRNKSVQPNNLISDKEFIQALKTAPNIRQALIRLKLAPAGANYIRAKNLLDKII